ncbi:MAG: lysophospholipid acyltransferase family protein [Planctomycetota bacterium]
MKHTGGDLAADASRGPPRFRRQLVWWTGNALLRGCFRLSVEQSPKLAGPYVVAANHTSFLDPLLLSAAQRRWVCYMMNEAVYRSTRFGWFYRFAGAIPVSLWGSNRAAVRAARAALDRGEVVGVFPEGGLSRDGLPYLGQPGAVSLVLSAGVPIVPAGIIDAHHALPADGGWPRFHRVRVRFGAPIQPEELAPSSTHRKKRLAVATERLMEEIAALTGHLPRATELATLRARGAEPRPQSPSR